VRQDHGVPARFRASIGPRARAAWLGSGKPEAAASGVGEGKASSQEAAKTQPEPIWRQDAPSPRSRTRRRYASPLPGICERAMGSQRRGPAAQSCADALSGWSADLSDGQERIATSLALRARSATRPAFSATHPAKDDAGRSSSARSTYSVKPAIAAGAACDLQPAGLLVVGGRPASAAAAITFPWG